ncbi:efflux transporter outer membrane subunit [Thiomicrorhabdus sp.]|uniref:efflux transporter outer membrane subunit n=1 Tax=Thiomicrorhabdus sp. TaxID=2039724 RepID=UPI0029C8E128|nr:efflux transporter outer membrane subunit [Thiomicrorhabdus sp.]
MLSNSMKTFLFPVAVLVLGGCSNLPQQADVTPQMPAAYLGTLVADGELDRMWWQSFNSPDLDQLIDKALQDSPDIKVATERVLQAEYALRSAGASRFPTLDVSGRSGTNGHYPNRGASEYSDSSSVTLGVSYELDFWQKNAAAIRGSEAGLQASRFDLAASRLSLAATVAQTYFDILSLNERLELARRNVRLAERLLEIVQARQENGVATSLDVSRQKTEVLTRKTEIAPLKNQLDQSQAALAVLTGSIPQNFRMEMRPIETLTMVEVNPGIPSELLKRRPDIAAEEFRLQSAQADIQAASAERFPQITLSASGGLASDVLLSLVSPAGSLALAAGDFPDVV